MLSTVLVIRWTLLIRVRVVAGLFYSFHPHAWTQAEIVLINRVMCSDAMRPNLKISYTTKSAYFNTKKVEAGPFATHRWSGPDIQFH